MHIVTVCFDRIFDAPRRRGFFSFESAGRKQYGVMLPGRRVPREGDRLAVALAQAGNWQAVLGWRDLGTREMVLLDTPWAIACDSLEPIWFFAVLLSVGGLLLAGAWGALAGLLVTFAAAATIAVRRLRRRYRVRAALAAAG